MAKTWQIFVGGVARNYRRGKFERRLETTKPTKFDATIQYNASIDYWDLVEFKRDGTTEYKGFVEILDIRWDENGRYLYIAGRDTKVILWKKYSDNFSNMHEDTKGFFGRVKAQDLLTFLLRTPKSDFDPENAYPNNKEGWGIDVSRFGDLTAARTSVGDPNYTKLRRRGYGWRNSGDPFASDTDVVDAEISNVDWTPHGASPYLDVEDDINYISSGTADATAVYSFTDLPANTTSVEMVHLTVVWKPDSTWWSWINTECDVYISPDGGTTWNYVGVFGGKGATWWRPNPWRHFSWDISSIINSVSKLNDCRVKFVNISTSLTTNITQAYLSVGYTTGGTQETYDRFNIPFSTETIVGVYVESRMDDESYPRDYEIVTVDNTEEDFSGYTEEDPNNHIALVGINHIDFDAHQNEDAWLRYDYGADYFGTYFKHTFDVKVVTDPVPEDGIMAGVWCLSNRLDDLYGLMSSGTDEFVALFIWRDPTDTHYGGAPCFVLYEQDGAGGTSAKSVELTEGITYSVAIERVGTSLIAYIYSDSTLFDTLSITLVGGNSYRYMIPVLTSNGETGSEAVNTNLFVTNFIAVNQDFTHENAVPWLNDSDVNYIWINNEVASEGLYDEYYWMANLDAKYESMTVSVAQVGIRAFTSIAGASCDIKVYLQVEDGGPWIGCPSMTVVHNGGTYANYLVNVPAGTLDTLAKINYARLKIVYETHIAGVGVINISKAWLHIEGTAYWTRTANTDIDIDDLRIEKETVLVTVTNNTYRDIIHSWTPQSMNHIRIRITSQDTSHSWAISQVYIYKAESCDYRVYKETGCTPTYAADQYISALSFDSSYTTALGPLNLPRSRLIDVINTVVKQCHADYVPYEWWLALDEDNTFHFKDQKFPAVYPTSEFATGTNLGGVKRTKDVSDTVQRVRIMGEGEGKRQEDVSSDWVEDVTAMGVVNSFYEDIVSEKSMVDKTMSELVANIHLNEEGDPKDQPIITIHNDSYASMVYDTGYYIRVTDSLTGTSGLHRAYNIIKEITGDGEVVTIVVDKPERDDADEWTELYRRLKELEVGGVTAADWTGEADKESEVSTEVITDFFEKTAKNDEDASKRDIKDPSWYMEPAPTSYTAPQDANAAGGNRGTPAQYSYANAIAWVHQNDWMKMLGPNAGDAIQTLLVELRGDSGEEINVYMRQNPKLVFELKIYEDTGTPVQWYNGDYFDVGLANAATDKGYFFRVKALGGAVFKIYACWNETGTPADTQEQLIRTITRNIKYRLEIITEDNNRLVIFNVYDMDQQQKYPPSIVKTNMDRDMLVRPLYMFLSAFDDNANPNVRASVYVYKFRTEWEKVQ